MHPLFTAAHGYGRRCLKYPHKFTACLIVTSLVLVVWMIISPDRFFSYRPLLLVHEDCREFPMDVFFQNSTWDINGNYQETDGYMDRYEFCMSRLHAVQRKKRDRSVIATALNLDFPTDVTDIIVMVESIHKYLLPLLSTKGELPVLYVYWSSDVTSSESQAKISKLEVEITRTLRGDTYPQAAVRMIDISDHYRTFPVGFDPEGEEPRRGKKRNKWGYAQMCRWNSANLFWHPSMHDVKYYFRLDADACFFAPFLADPFARQPNQVYLRNQIDWESEGAMCGLRAWYHAYMQYKKYPRRVSERAHSVLATKHFRNFYTNFELIDVELYLQNDNLVETTCHFEASLNILRFRWGDAPIRTLLLQSFFERQQIAERGHYSMPYRHTCHER